MKLADIVPLYKSKEKYLESNYRPISLLTMMSKLLEKIVYVRVYEFLNSSGQLYESQHGFHSSHSCDNAVGEVVSRIVKNLEAGKINIAIFLDLSKVFDTLNHDLLLHKMERYGIRGITLEWLRSYLHARKLRVKCKPTSTGQLTTSEEYTVKYGAPQCSCLGPLLFLIFCNDLKLNLEYLHVIQFADDTTLTMGHRNHNYLKYCIETDLTSVQDWFNVNTLTLNLSKSNYMTFFPHSKREKITLDLSLNGITLPKITSTKFLGTWIDEKLIWKEHLIRLTTKLTSRLGMLRRCKRFLTVHAMKTLYYAQINSIIAYGISMWGPMASHHQLKQIQNQHYKAVKLIDYKHKKGDTYRTHWILNVHQLTKLELCKLGYRLTNNLLPKPLTNELLSDQHNKNLGKMHGYNTRHKSIPNLPRANNSRYRSSYIFQAISAYSKLPDSVTKQPTLKSFISRCKQHLIEKNSG